MFQEILAKIGDKTNLSPFCIFMLRGEAMRTTVEIDSKLFNEAMRLTKAHTKKELVQMSLKEIIRRKKVERLIGMLGRFSLDLTDEKLSKMREEG
jgi:Arc/MetJ family transcription regulator